MEARDKTREPFDGIPPRLPGQSLQFMILQRYWLEYGSWVLVLGILSGAALWDCFSFIVKLPHLSVLWLLVLAPALGIALWRVKRLDRKMNHVILGMRGERWVGRHLERETRSLGYEILHDIPFDEKDKSNIDHVLIGPGGIYVVETKSRSKPIRGEAQIRYDGKSITVNGHKIDRDPIAQVMGAKARIRDLLERETGRKGKIPVYPVIVFPGWWVDSPLAGDVWVLSLKAFPTLLANERVRLQREDIALYTARLEDYVRRIDEQER